MKKVITIHLKKQGKCDFFLPSKQAEMILSDKQIFGVLKDGAESDGLKTMFDGKVMSESNK